MKRLICSASVALLLAACAAEERSDSTTTTASTETTATTATTATTERATTTASDTAAAVPADHDVTGGYFAIDPLPAEFAELEHLLLANIDENGAPAPLNGFLRPKKREASDYTLVQPSLTGRRLTFTTTANGGVHYAFDGQFEVLGKFPENPPSYETVVLTGTLQRMREGKTVASTPVRFRYEAGG